MWFLINYFAHFWFAMCIPREFMWQKVSHLKISVLLFCCVIVIIKSVNLLSLLTINLQTLMNIKYWNNMSKKQGLLCFIKPNVLQARFFCDWLLMVLMSSLFCWCIMCSISYIVQTKILFVWLINIGLACSVFVCPTVTATHCNTLQRTVWINSIVFEYGYVRDSSIHPCTHGLDLITHIHV